MDMRAEKLADAIGEVRDDYILDADKTVKRNKGGILKWCAAAACFCLIAAAAVAVPGMLKNKNTAAPAAGTDAEIVSNDSVSRSPETEQTTVLSGEQPAPDNSGNIPKPVTDLPKANEQTPLPNSTENIAGTEDGQSVNEPDVNIVQGPFLPADNPGTITEFTPMISGYGESTMIDMAVYNGGVELSQQLADALAAKGDSVHYRVLVELFRDGVQIYSGSEEAIAESERLAALGYITAMETYNDGSTEQTYFTIHATAEQLESFKADSGFGYYIVFYDEYFGSSGIEGSVIFSYMEPVAPSENGQYNVMLLTEDNG